MKACILAVALALGVTGTAAAERPAAKPAAKPMTRVQRAKLDKKLRGLVGKKPAPVVNLYNGHTDEWLVVDAKKQATVPQETMDEFFRCHFTNQRANMDLRLVPVLVDAAMHFGKQKILIVSGFRAPKYNLILRKKGREVARQSQHSEGNAIDFRLPGVPTKKLLEFVKGRRLGGVGFYPESAFVHADTGRVRYWAGR